MLIWEGEGMGYYLDLNAIRLDEYQAILENADLLPSRRVLQENTAAIFKTLKAQGLATVADLQKALKSKAKLQRFAEESGLDEGYLKILIREVNSLQPKPNKLADFPETPAEAVSGLASLGIRHTLQLFDRVLTPEARAALAAEAGVDEGEILRLARLTDLSRIRWVNHTFAYILLETGYNSSAKVAQADPAQLHADVIRLNEERGFYKAKIGLHDMVLCVNAAKEVSQEIVF
jgi:hypothetical protein